MIFLPLLPIRKDVMLPKFFAILSIFLCTLTQAHAQVYDCADEAFQIARDSNKTVLLVFAGSDWCPGCIRFEKKILSERYFQDFVGGHLVVLKADFPQRKTLTAAIKKQNAMLAEKYNPDGLFPYLLLVSPDQIVIASLQYNNQSPAEFIDEIKGYLSE